MTWRQEKWKAGLWQKSHPLLTVVPMGENSLPTDRRRRAVVHFHASGDVGNRRLSPLRASRNGYNQNYLVR